MSSLSCVGSLKVGTEVKAYARIARVGRRQGHYFFSLRTGDTVDDVPAMCPKSLLERPTIHSTLQFTGTIQESPKDKQLEIHITQIHFYGEFPSDEVTVKYGVDDKSLRHMESQRLLTKKYQSMLRVYSHMMRAVDRVCGDLTRVRTPYITFSDCEGGGEVFKVVSDIKDFFSRPAYLTVSGQVDEETITSRLLCPTYAFGPSFRSDPSQTRWHACEFYHLEPEYPFVDLPGLMDKMEGIVKGLLKEAEHVADSLKYLRKDPVDLDTETPFSRVSYTEAVKILQRMTFEKPVVWGDDLTKEHERYLCEVHFGRPTFVYGYPSKIKSFYMSQCPPFVDLEVSDEPLYTCEGVDLLVPGIGELCGGSTREYRYEVLIATMKEKGLRLEDYEEYLSLRRQGTFPHAGFGMGFDRFIMYITQCEHIKDVCAFPRYYGK